MHIHITSFLTQILLNLSSNLLPSTFQIRSLLQQHIYELIDIILTFFTQFVKHTNRYVKIMTLRIYVYTSTLEY